MQATAFGRTGNFVFLLSANTILGLAMPLLIILGGLSGLYLAPTTALATLPASVQTLAGLFAAAPFSLLMGRFGRKPGFFAGAGLAIVGGLIGVLALLKDSFVLLCVAHLALGAALACYQYFRFAAAEVVSSTWQPVAISLMLTSGLVAALAGPQVFIMTKDVLAPIQFAGAYAAIAIISSLGLVPLAFASLPKPNVAISSTVQTSSKRWLTGFEVLKRKRVRTAVSIGAISQGIMVLIMIPTPLAMIGCGFAEATASDVVRWHVVAMFAPSFYTGFLIKRFGSNLISMIGLILLSLSALIAASGLSTTHFYVALIILGIGWNFGFIGATNMLANAVSEGEKSVAQGVNDTIIALVSTVCAFSGGTIIAAFGWEALAISAFAVLVVKIAYLALSRPETARS